MKTLEEKIISMINKHSLRLFILGSGDREKAEMKLAKGIIKLVSEYDYEDINSREAWKDEVELRKCIPCKVCNVRPVWGSGFLVCPVCGKETGYNSPNGKAVREWNKMNKE